MNEIINALHEGKRLRLIATVLELLQYEKADNAVIPIPGTLPPRYIAVGTAATVAQLLEIDQGGEIRAGLADDSRFRQMMHEYLMGQATIEQVAARLEEWRGDRGHLVAVGPDSTVKTWRERIGAGADFPLHGPTDVERAMVGEIAELRALLAPTTPGRAWTLRRSSASAAMSATAEHDHSEGGHHD